MKTLVLFPLLLTIAVVVIVLAVILGDYGSGYFAWLMGTVMMTLVAAGGALMDAEELPDQR